MNAQRRAAAIEAVSAALDRRGVALSWADAAAVIDAALPHLVGEPVGYVLANLVRRTVWMEQGVSTVVDDARHLREPRGDFVRCALVPVEDES